MGGLLWLHSIPKRRGGGGGGGSPIGLWNGMPHLLERPIWHDAPKYRAACIILFVISLNKMLRRKSRPHIRADALLVFECLFFSLLWSFDLSLTSLLATQTARWSFVENCVTYTTCVIVKARYAQGKVETKHTRQVQNIKNLPLHSSGLKNVTCQMT